MDTKYNLYTKIITIEGATKTNKNRISKMKYKLVTFTLLTTFGVNANQLNYGDNLIPVNAKSTSKTYTISGSGQRTLTTDVPNSIDYDMYIVQTLPDGSTKEICKPFNYPNDNEICYLNLDIGTFQMYIENLSNVSRYADVSLQSYTCSPSLYQTPLIICPVSSAIEKANSFNKSWKISYSSVHPSRTHIGADRYADDINWSSGNNDLKLPVAAPIYGEIIFNGRVSSSESKDANAFGNQVIIYNPYAKVAARLAHLNKTLSPSVNWVTTGDYVGEIGRSGTILSHLHLVLYYNIDDTALNNLKKGIFPNGTALSGGNYSKYTAPFYFKSDFRMPRVDEK